MTALEKAILQKAGKPRPEVLRCPACGGPCRPPRGVCEVPRVVCVACGMATLVLDEHPASRG